MRDLHYSPAKLSSFGQGTGESSFWQTAGASWRRVAGGFKAEGFSFEWQEWESASAVDWGRSFHAGGVEICLNLKGTGWVRANGKKLEFEPQSAGFIAVNGVKVEAERAGGQRHEFLSVEYDLGFLRQKLAAHTRELHPTLLSCMEGDGHRSDVSGRVPLTHRHAELMKSLLKPPVLASAQRLWYEVKALEFAAEFFFAPGAGETLCTRAQRIAAERVARAKTVLAENLVEPLPLEELGKRVGCSPFYLSRTFTQVTGMTLSQWLRRVRLQKAAELLKSGRCNVTEAAFEVGYSSLSHFSEAFHEMYGCCPGLFPLRTPTQTAATREGR